MSEMQRGTEDDALREPGDTGGSAQRGGEGGGGSDGEESFTMGGPRGEDAERGDYDEPAAEPPVRERGPGDAVPGESRGGSPAE